MQLHIIAKFVNVVKFDFNHTIINIVTAPMYHVGKSKQSNFTNLLHYKKNYN